MKLAKKIGLLVGVIGALYFISIWLFPHNETPLASDLNRFMQTLLFAISIFIFLKEPNRNNKFISLNFLIYFFSVLLFFVYDFVGKAFWTSGRYAPGLFFQYISIVNLFFLSLAVIYLVIDTLFRDLKVYQKFLSTFVFLFLLFGFFFHPFFTDPMYLSSTEDFKQLRTLQSYVIEHKEPLSTVELANKVTLQSWNNGVAVGDLYPQRNLERIEYLTPFLEGGNVLVLFWRPLYLKTIQVDMWLIGAIIIFFGYQYKKDPPQGAYVDKIMFLILLLCSMDIVHYWGFVMSVEWGSFVEIFKVGQYITVFAQFMLVLFFSLRLRFITSVQGEFYETELATNPRQVSRWRDWIDNLVLNQFFNFKIFNGRLFQGSPEKRN